jgi:hypothetical protein
MALFFETPWNFTDFSGAAIKQPAVDAVGAPLMTLTLQLLFCF